MRHPWIVERAQRALREAGSPEGLVVAGERTVPALIHLMQGLAAGLLQERLAQEESMIALVMALARDLHAPPIADPLVVLVDQVLVAHPEQSPGVATLARQAGLSRGQFSVRFRAATGTSPAHYIAQRRVEAARREVEALDEPLAVIARRHGFVDERHMRRVFLRHYHVRPSDCRRA